MGDKGSKQQRHVSQISSACCLRNGCTPEPLWDVRGCVFCGGGWHTHTQTHTQLVVEAVTAFVLEPHSSTYTRSSNRRARTRRSAFLSCGFKGSFFCSLFWKQDFSVFSSGDCWMRITVLFYFFFFSPCGCTSGRYLITEYFLLFWILIFKVESNNPMSLELFSS